MMNSERLPDLTFVIDSNVWINAYTSCGNAKRYERERARGCIEKALKNGAIITNFDTTEDLEQKLDQFVEESLLFRRDVDAVKKQFHTLTTSVKKEKGYFARNLDDLRKCNDDNDWCFLALADTHKAFAIVSGDKHLLRVRYKDVKILSPQQFILERLPVVQHR